MPLKKYSTGDGYEILAVIRARPAEKEFAVGIMDITGRKKRLAHALCIGKPPVKFKVLPRFDVVLLMRLRPTVRLRSSWGVLSHRMPLENAMASA